MNIAYGIRFEFEIDTLKTSSKNKVINKALKYQPNKAIQHFYEKGEEFEENEQEHEQSISLKTGYHLYKLIKLNNLKEVLEIGMKDGISSLYICSALSELKSIKKSLISVDPEEFILYENFGVSVLKENNLSYLNKLYYDEEYKILSKFNEEKQKFNLIFINGKKTLDYLLSIFILADNLSRIGTVIVIEDITNNIEMEEAIQFLKTNYLHWGFVNKTICDKTTATFVKWAEDQRPWFFNITFRIKK
jgi:predicted O-methyltransferase YrrM